MSEEIKFGLLDFGYRAKGSSALTILRDVVKYADHADKLGFQHLWFGEHHGSSPAWSNPTMLLPVLAGLTTNIRIGIAGILLKYYSAYAVASDFKMLATLYPGRIDLGLANGGMEPSYAGLFNVVSPAGDSPGKSFDRQMELLMDFLVSGQITKTNNVTVAPQSSEMPDVWRLSQSFASIGCCLEYGNNFSVSTFHKNSSIVIRKEQLEEIKQEFFEKYKKPLRINLAFSGLYLKQGNRSSAANYPDWLGQGAVVGDLPVFKEKIQGYVEELGIRDFTFMDMQTHALKRMQTLEMLVELKNSIK